MDSVQPDEGTRQDAGHPSPEYEPSPEFREAAELQATRLGIAPSKLAFSPPGSLDKWPGCRLETAVLRVVPELEAAFPDHHYLHGSNDDGAQRSWLIVLARLTRDGLDPRAYAEVRLHPSRSEIAAHIPSTLPHKDRGTILKGLDLLAAWVRQRGGRPAGTRKGRQLSAQKIWDWWQGWDDLRDERPTLKDLAARMRVRSLATARGRLREAGQTWPPTDPRKRKKGVF